MIEDKDHNLILGQLYLNSVKLSLKDKSDRISYIIIYSYTNYIAIFSILDP